MRQMGAHRGRVGLDRERSAHLSGGVAAVDKVSIEDDALRWREASAQIECLLKTRGAAVQVAHHGDLRGGAQLDHAGLVSQHGAAGAQQQEQRARVQLCPLAESSRHV